MAQGIFSFVPFVTTRLQVDAAIRFQVATQQSSRPQMNVPLLFLPFRRRVLASGSSSTCKTHNVAAFPCCNPRPPVHWISFYAARSIHKTARFIQIEFIQTL